MFSMVALDTALQETMFFMFMSFSSLLGEGGVIYIPRTLVPLKSLGLDLQRFKKLALKLHAHYVHYAHKLVQSRRSLEHSLHLQTDQERSADLSSCNPPDPH